MTVGCTDRASLGIYGASSSGTDAVLTGGPPNDASSESTGDDAPARCPAGRGCGGSCPESCGALESPYDTNGCVRPQCANDEECGTDERCFVAAEFGRCEPVGLTCEHTGGDAGQCSCTDDGTCEGGHCVPADLWPVEEDVELGTLFLVLGCFTADEVVLWIASGGVPGMGCEGTPPSDPDLSLVFAVPGEPPFEVSLQSSDAHGTYRGTDGVVEDVWLARLELDDLIDPSVSGTLEVYVPDAGALRVFTIDLVNVTLCGPGSCP